MSLAAGMRLGPYEILRPLGAGGMGEVYRARDTELKRDVALKVLPPPVASDDGRVLRFEREAELLATLNHPHIAAIYGLYRAAPVTALVLELVEGDTLAERIARGPQDAAQAVQIAAQIVSALEGAHERGIVHRDLKPANIKIRPDGTVKVLDFGLAKALTPATSAADASQSTTITSPAMTHAGALLGTAAYMSPEQARGEIADERSDIWAFGCVLFEMLAGQRAFRGEGIADALASVLRSEPDWSQLPAGTPDSIRRLLRRCLQKDPSRRLADIRDARLELEERDPGTVVSAPVTPPLARERLLWAAALTAAAAAVVVLWTRGPQAGPDQRPDYSFLAIPATTDPAAFALAPDGRQVVFVASLDGRPQLWHFSRDTGQRKPLRGTSDASSPFWSPDSRSIGFFRNERLYRMEIEGGATRAIARAAIGTGGTWNDDNVILFTPVPDAPVLRVGGDLDGFIDLPGSAGRRGPVGERFPQFLPDGRHFLYYKLESRQVFLGSIEGPERSVLIDGTDSAAVVAAPNHVLFVRGGELLMQRLDLTRRQLTGSPRSLGSDVAVDATGAPAVSASANGAVLFRTGSGDKPRRLTIVNRKGEKIRDVFGPDPSYPMNVELCPGARTVVLNRTVGGNTGIDQIELDRGIPTTLTSSAMPEIAPLCSPRGITFAILGGKGTLARLQPGVSTPVSLSTVNSIAGIPVDEASNGTLLYRALGMKTGWDIWTLEPGSAPRPILTGPEEERSAQFSPDGKWFAYESNEVGGMFEIFVQPYPGGAKKRVSVGGGAQPRWEGDEILYVAADGHLTSARAVRSPDGRSIELSPSMTLFPVQIESTVQGGIDHAYAVFPGGREFLLSTFTELPPQALVFIRNVSP